MLNMMCAIRIVVKPVAMPTERNSDSSDAPSTTSGVASGRKMKKFVGAAAAELVAHERERHQRAEHRRDDRRERRDLEAVLHRVGEPRDRERVLPVLEREPLPGEVEAALVSLNENRMMIAIGSSR